MSLGIRFMVAVGLIVSGVATASPARAQTPYLWIDADAEPSNMARGWFTTNGGNAANIMVSGTTTLNAALGRLAANDRIYTLAHGVSGTCARGGQSFTGGRIRLEGADRRGFGAGTDPNGSCAAGGAPYGLPNQRNFTWRMLTCNSGTVPGWDGGLSVVASAQSALGNTVTISGANQTQSVTMRFFVRGGGTAAQWAACIGTFNAWAQANQGGRTVNAWYDATAFGDHGANFTALQNGPVAAYNQANGTTFNMTRQAYIWTPAIPGTPPVVAAPADEMFGDEPDDIAECQVADQATATARETWGQVKSIYR